MRFNEPLIRIKEDKLNGSLILLLSLYDKDLIDMPRTVELGQRLIRNARDDIIAYLALEADAQGLPHPDEEAALPQLKRSLIDFEKEVQDYDLESEAVIIRVQRTGTYIIWSSLNQFILGVAKKLGVGTIYFQTQQDERVCPVCLEAEGAYPITEAPIPPLHVSCRCFLRLT